MIRVIMKINWDILTCMHLFNIQVINNLAQSRVEVGDQKNSLKRVVKLCTTLLHNKGFQ